MASTTPDTPAASGVSSDSVFNQVSNAYRNVWRVCPYTSFAMFNYLVKDAGTLYSLGTWESFLKTSAHNLAEAGLPDEAVMSELPEDLWKKNSGLCTSFAIRVVAASEQTDFTYGDTGIHRAGELPAL